jgi:hypothetical protein
MFCVTNKQKDERKFRDNYKGADIIVGPGQTVKTNNPPAISDTWDVKPSEEIEKKSTPVNKKTNKESE